MRGSLNKDSHLSEKQRNMHTYCCLTLSSYSGKFESFLNCTLFKDLIKNIENIIQMKNYSMQFFFDQVKEDLYYLYPDQNSEQLLIYMLNCTSKFAALMNIILKVMHDDKFKEKQRLLIIEKQLMIMHLTVLFVLWWACSQRSCSLFTQTHSRTILSRSLICSALLLISAWELSSNF